MTPSSFRAEFEAFVSDVEQKLRVALTAVFGQDGGRDAASAALLYAWENWDRVRVMENPAGYLYRVGRSSQRRHKEPTWRSVPLSAIPDVEPGLPEAISRLSEKQRLAVVLVHAYGWTRKETAETVGMSVSTLDTHLARGLARLRSALGVDTRA